MVLKVEYPRNIPRIVDKIKKKKRGGRKNVKKPPVKETVLRHNPYEDIKYVSEDECCMIQDVLPEPKPKCPPHKITTTIANLDLSFELPDDDDDDDDVIDQNMAAMFGSSDSDSSWDGWTKKKESLKGKKPKLKKTAGPKSKKCQKDSTNETFEFKPPAKKKIGPKSKQPKEKLEPMNIQDLTPVQSDSVQKSLEEAFAKNKSDSGITSDWNENKISTKNVDCSSISSGANGKTAATKDVVAHSSISSGSNDKAATEELVSSCNTSPESEEAEAKDVGSSRKGSDSSKEAHSRSRSHSRPCEHKSSGSNSHRRSHSRNGEHKSSGSNSHRKSHSRNGKQKTSGSHSRSRSHSRKGSHLHSSSHSRSWSHSRTRAHKSRSHSRSGEHKISGSHSRSRSHSRNGEHKSSGSHSRSSSQSRNGSHLHSGSHSREQIHSSIRKTLGQLPNSGNKSMFGCSMRIPKLNRQPENPDVSRSRSSPAKVQSKHSDHPSSSSYKKSYNSRKDQYTSRDHGNKPSQYDAQIQKEPKNQVPHFRVRDKEPDRHRNKETSNHMSANRYPTDQSMRNPTAYDGHNSTYRPESYGRSLAQSQEFSFARSQYVNFSHEQTAAVKKKISLESYNARLQSSKHGNATDRSQPSNYYDPFQSSNRDYNPATMNNESTNGQNLVARVPASRYVDPKSGSSQDSMQENRLEMNRDNLMGGYYYTRVDAPRPGFNHLYDAYYSGANVSMQENTLDVINGNTSTLNTQDSTQNGGNTSAQCEDQTGNKMVSPTSQEPTADYSNALGPSSPDTLTPKKVEDLRLNPEPLMTAGGPSNGRTPENIFASDGTKERKFSGQIYVKPNAALFPSETSYEISTNVCDVRWYCPLCDHYDYDSKMAFDRKQVEMHIINMHAVHIMDMNPNLMKKTCPFKECGYNKPGPSIFYHLMYHHNFLEKKLRELNLDMEDYTPISDRTMRPLRFQCLKCNKKMVTSKESFFHLAMAHYNKMLVPEINPNEAELSNCTKKFRCQEIGCGQTFYTRNGQLAHEELFHDAMKVYFGTVIGNDFMDELEDEILS